MHLAFLVHCEMLPIDTRAMETGYSPGPENVFPALAITEIK